MKKLRLKDREFQEKLDARSKNLFSASLQHNWNKRGEKSNTIICDFSGLIFEPDEVEEYEEYEPQAWNSYPDCKPPEKVLMRLEFKVESCSEVMTHYIGAIFSRGAWRYMTGEAVDLDDAYEVRYRPWEDPRGDE